MIEKAHTLVTGGAGFIGSHLCEQLLAQGNHVVCLDNFSTGRLENIDGCLNHPRFRLIEGDIRDQADCKQACKGMDYVIHQAALGSVPASIEDPLLSAEVNIQGFLQVSLAARDANIKRLVYAASSAIYGDNHELPHSEGASPKPLSPYAISKHVNELYAESFASLYGMESVGLRFFNVFGPRQNSEGAYAAVIPKFACQLIRHESPVINGDGSISRDFIYIKDVLLAIQLAATCRNKKAVNQVYNIASGRQTSLMDLAYLLRQTVAGIDPAAKNVSLKFGPERQSEVTHSRASIVKAEIHLGFQPVFELSDGLRETAAWYFENLRNPTGRKSAIRN